MPLLPSANAFAWRRSIAFKKCNGRQWMERARNLASAPGIGRRRDRWVTTTTPIGERARAFRSRNAAPNQCARSLRGSGTCTTGGSAGVGRAATRFWVRGASMRHSSFGIRSAFASEQPPADGVGFMWRSRVVETPSCLARRISMRKALIPAIAGALIAGATTSVVIKRRALKKAALAARSKVTKLLANGRGTKRRTARKRS
jgi:hypothetical protein